MHYFIIALLFCFLPQSEQYKFVDTAKFTLAPSIELHLKASVFDETKHVIEHCIVGPSSDPWKGICLIDGQPVFGTDWEVPRTMLVQAYVMNGKTKIPLDISCMYNPWFASADEKSFSAKATEGGIVIDAHFSDGGRSYDAKWLIIQGKSIRLKLDHSEE